MGSDGDTHFQDVTAELRTTNFAPPAPPIPTDGETRQLRPGNVFRLEDTSPCKGHITVVGDQPGFLMFVR
jgi:hypothetical protein